MDQIDLHWEKYADIWSQVGPPLAPPPEAIACYADLVRAHAATAPAQPHALILGVTGALATLPYPPQTRIIALEHSMKMIEHVWQKAGHAETASLRGHWLRLPFADDSLDYVLGDGSANSLDYPAGYRGLFAELGRVMRKDALCILRVFVQNKVPDTLGTIHWDLARGAIRNFHVLKWRLVMATHTDLHAGVLLHDVWKNWLALKLDPDDLQRRFGWSPALQATVGIYRDSPVRYSLPQLRDLDAMAGSRLRRLAVYYPVYEFGEFCPIVVFARGAS